MMDLAEATVIVFTSPIWAAIMAAVFEKGAWTIFDTCGTLICLSGIVVLVQPPPFFPSDTAGSFVDQIPGFCAALIAAISMAGPSLRDMRAGFLLGVGLGLSGL
jgi:drug/metabolite transporter (DMT)-like permease